MWHAAERASRTSADAEATDEMIEVTCDECGKRSRFPAVLKGRVEDCPQCGATIDVGDDADFAVPDNNLSDAGPQDD
jgi:endogenous inhibitor of DNA gyrase (YacG/DUF329 family)